MLTSCAQAYHSAVPAGCQVGRENPSELKAQKLARSVTRGLVDRDLKPDVEEKRQIDAILLYPPNRSPSALLCVQPGSRGSAQLCQALTEGDCMTLSCPVSLIESVPACSTKSERITA